LIEQLTTAVDSLIMQGKYGDAESCCRAALGLIPDNVEFLVKLSGILLHLDRTEEALPFLELALVIRPHTSEILNNLAVAYKKQGMLDQSIACYKEAVVLAPKDNHLHSNLLMAMIYTATVSPENLAATARQFGETVANEFLRSRILIRDKDPKRKLRIGYVSPDFRDHAVNYFFEFLLKYHDRAQFEIFGYSCATREDHVTARIKPALDHWRNITPMSDDIAADTIENDEVDILIDMAGHTADNRLLVFARKPAPIQVTWLGFPATTGMKAMDYRITDSYAEPHGMTESLNTETLWRIPEIFCCYGAHESNPNVINYPPFESNGYITFGCFNNFAKVTDPVLATWAKIMANVPESHLLLEIAGLEGPKFQNEVENRLQKHGLPLDRIILEPRKRCNQFVLYNKIDIALDPFPCVGGTTSMDTLWMGVPLVTLAGRHFVSRMGVSILTNAGLPELIAQNVDEYVKLAVDLANDRERLCALRHNLRDKVGASPLMDQKRFTRNMEAAYREMWRRWCLQIDPEKHTQSR
jgi:predicted O-linked N-acetylglucosamine transferase (SPINDLY family)